MRGLIFCLAAFLLLAQAGTAGPWAREQGGAFAALSIERDREDNRYTGLYAEYGLTERTTIGLEFGRTRGERTALLWWQPVLGSGEGPNHWAVSLGIGMIQRDGRRHPMGQIATAWGRGLDSIPMLRRIPGGGWLAVETRSKIAAITKDMPERPDVIYEDPTYLTPETTHKLDLTLGWHAREKLMLINQLRFEQRDDTGFSGKLSVSVVRDLWGPSRLELGLIEPLSGDGERAIKLGTWVEF